MKEEKINNPDEKSASLLRIHLIDISLLLLLVLVCTIIILYQWFPPQVNEHQLVQVLVGFPVTPGFLELQECMQTPVMSPGEYATIDTVKVDKITNQALVLLTISAEKSNDGNLYFFHFPLKQYSPIELTFNGTTYIDGTILEIRNISLTPKSGDLDGQ